MNPSHLNFQAAKRTFLQAVIGGSVNPLTGANKVPVGPHSARAIYVARSSGPCSRCLSHKHGRSTCLGPIPPRFPGLSQTAAFSNQMNLNGGDKVVVAQWFK